MNSIINTDGRPNARMGNGLGGRRCRKKRKLFCNETDRAADGGNTQPERVQTSEAGFDKRNT